MEHDALPVLAVSDPSFSTDELFLYDLLVYFDEEAVTAAIFHSGAKKFVAMEHHRLSNESSPAEAFTKVMETSGFLSASGFRKTVFASGYRTSTLVPNPLYSPGTAELHLGFGNNLESGLTILTDELTKVDARNIYAVPEWLQKIIAEHFPGATIVHASSQVIEYLATVHKNNPREFIFADVSKSHITVVVTSGQKLLLYNTYTYENAEGLVYFILFALEQLQLNPESVRLRFSGEISEEEPAFGLAHKYIRDTAIMERPESFSYSAELDSIPQQHLFTLYLQALCVS